MANGRSDSEGFATMRLTEAELAEFHERGFLVRENLFSAAEVAVLRAELPAILAEDCTMEEIESEARGCTVADAISFDTSTTAKPSTLSGFVQPGTHTLVIFNFGPGAEDCSYRITLP